MFSYPGKHHLYCIHIVYNHWLVGCIRIDDHSETNDQIHKEYIDDFKIYSVKNIQSYTHVNFNSWHINVGNSETTYTSKIQHYFAADTFIHTAFSHWVYETGIYLPLFKKLKAIYPDTKIYFQDKRQFKILFCKYFEIEDEDIVYSFDTSIPSICYFPSPISALNETYLNPTYVTYLNRFMDYFIDKENKEIYSVNIMPRQTKENYKGNDRIIQFDKIIESTSVIENRIITLTDSIDNLQSQIDAIRFSKVNVFTDGSPFLVNGMFSHNKHIIVSGQMCTDSQSMTYHKLGYIRQRIIDKNKSVSFIQGQDDTVEKIVSLLNS
jgi:hypothetical protein